jgi:hypothetical protein
LAIDDSGDYKRRAGICDQSGAVMWRIFAALSIDHHCTNDEVKKIEITLLP